MNDLSAFNGGATLSSPNKIVWEYFASLQRLTFEAKNSSTPELCRQNSALAIIMAVTVVEVFLNLWFRIRVEELQSTIKRDAFLKDISSRKSLEHKLKSWPKSYLEESLNLSSGAGAEFIKLKELRNSIVHFSSTHETFQYENLVINGLANTTEYDSLSFKKAEWALFTAENLVAEIFRLAGVSNENICHMLHGWTGRSPT